MSAVHPLIDQALDALRGPAKEEPIAKLAAEIRGPECRYRIEGTLPQVLEMIRALFTEYDYRGYGTRLQDMQGVYPAEQYVALVTRNSSCD